VSHRIPLTFLGTGNAFAPGHDWNAFLVGDRILVETAPSVLPNLHRAGIDRQTIDVIFLSHFHADHSFGWPFLLLDYLAQRRTSDLWVVGPPGIQAFLEQMLRAAAFDHIVQHIRSELGGFPLHYVEVTETEQEAGGVRFRAVKVEHDPVLRCYGYLIEQGGRSLGYSGDTRLCAGLRELAGAADVLVLEASARHGVIGGHMDLDCVRRLREEFPRPPFILTHTSSDVDSDGIPDVCVATHLGTLRV
jgi:ribonuclease Z